jgi:hypothetical protein
MEADRTAIPGRAVVIPSMQTEKHLEGIVHFRHYWAAPHDFVHLIVKDGGEIIDNYHRVHEQTHVLPSR